MSEPVEVSSIVIRKMFDDSEPEGAMTVDVQYSEGLTLLDALGLLAFTSATTVDNYQRNREGRDD